MNEVEALKNLVDEFAQFARLPAANLAPGSLHEVIDQALSLYDGLFAGVRIERRLAPDVPALRLDADQMKRVLINLVDNAIEATDKQGHGGDLDRVRPRAGPGAPGRGRRRARASPPGPRQAVRARTSRPRSAGSGLGLAIVSRIVQEHQGVDPRGGQPARRGARFVVELPA